MKTNDEFAHNKMIMKRCNKAYNIIVTIYAGVCLFYAGVALFQIFLGATHSPFMTFLDGIFFKSALLSCGFLACYKHNTKFALFAMVIAVINIFIADGLNGLICAMTVILSLTTVLCNKEYHYLENQFGFPYFNERFEEQNIDTRQREIKDEYQQNYERYMKTSSSDMSDIGSVVRSADLVKKDNDIQIDTMDNI